MPAGRVKERKGKRGKEKAPPNKAI